MKVVDKMLGLIGLEMEEVEDYQEEETREEWQSETRGKKAPVVSLHTQKNIKMIIVKPGTYDDVQEVAEHLKNRRPTIVNLEDTEKELAQRIVDFMSGATYALSGNLQKISAGIFVCTPSNIDITGAISEEKEKPFFAWGTKF